MFTWHYMFTSWMQHVCLNRLQLWGKYVLTHRKPMDKKCIKKKKTHSSLSVDSWSSLFQKKEVRRLQNHSCECCHFVIGNLCMWYHEQGWHVGKSVFYFVSQFFVLLLFGLEQTSMAMPQGQIGSKNVFLFLYFSASESMCMHLGLWTCSLLCVMFYGPFINCHSVSHSSVALLLVEAPYITWR